MFGRKRRHEERLYCEGFRDALVHGVPPFEPFGSDYPQPASYTKGFRDGRAAAKRIHRDALVSEVSRLSLKPGDKLVVKVRELTAPAAEAIKGHLKQRFPDNEILVCDGDTNLSVVRPETIVVQSVLDGKVVAQAVAEIGNDQVARA
jgi:hypothetical protein